MDYSQVRKDVMLLTDESLRHRLLLFQRGEIDTAEHSIICGEISRRAYKKSLEGDPRFIHPRPYTMDDPEENTRP